jgi:outer membrane protein assembly factor BamB
MQMPKTTLPVMFYLTLVLSMGSVMAAEGLIASPEPDWPQWRGPRRDGVSVETGLLAHWPAHGPKLLWSVDGLGKGWSSPIVVGQCVYITGDVGDDLIIFAFDHDGKPVWQTKNGKVWEKPYPGARASCAFSEGMLYHLNAHGRLVCLDAMSGQEQWAVSVLERFGGKNITWALSECLLIDGPHVIVTPGAKGALMAALDKRNGRTVWTTEALADDLASHSSPILFQYAGRRILANCSSAHGFGVDADTGKLLWTVPLKNPHGVNASTPVYGKGHIYYVTPYAEQGRLYRLLAQESGITAQHVWTSPLDTVTGSSVLVGNALYAAGYRACKWWMGVDWTTGKTQSQLKDLTTGAAIHAQGQLYCLDEKGTVALLKPDAQDLNVVSRFKPITGRVKNDAWAHPVLCHGRLYIRYHDQLWCYDVKDPN